MLKYNVFDIKLTKVGYLKYFSGKRNVLVQIFFKSTNKANNTYIFACMCTLQATS